MWVNVHTRCVHKILFVIFCMSWMLFLYKGTKNFRVRPLLSGGDPLCLLSLPVLYGHFVNRRKPLKYNNK